MKTIFDEVNGVNGKVKRYLAQDAEIENGEVYFKKYLNKKGIK